MKSLQKKSWFYFLCCLLLTQQAWSEDNEIEIEQKSTLLLCPVLETSLVLDKVFEGVWETDFHLISLEKENHYKKCCKGILALFNNHIIFANIIFTDEGCTQIKSIYNYTAQKIDFFYSPKKKDPFFAVQIFFLHDKCFAICCDSLGFLLRYRVYQKDAEKRIYAFYKPSRLRFFNKKPYPYPLERRNITSDMMIFLGEWVLQKSSSLIHNAFGILSPENICAEKIQITINFFKKVAFIDSLDENKQGDLQEIQMLFLPIEFIKCVRNADEAIAHIYIPALKIYTFLFFQEKSQSLYIQDGNCFLNSVQFPLSAEHAYISHEIFKRK